jgi:hypothetical protein
VPQLGDYLDWRTAEIPTRSVIFEVAQQLFFSGQRPYVCFAQPEGLGIKEKTT